MSLTMSCISIWIKWCSILRAIAYYLLYYVIKILLYDSLSNIFTIKAKYLWIFSGAETMCDLFEVPLAVLVWLWDLMMNMLQIWTTQQMFSTYFRIFYKFYGHAVQHNTAKVLLQRIYFFVFVFYTFAILYYHLSNYSFRLHSCIL